MGLTSLVRCALRDGLATRRRLTGKGQGKMGRDRLGAPDDRGWGYVVTTERQVRLL